RKQNLLTPIVLGGDAEILLNASVDDDKVQISRIASGHSRLPDMKSESALSLDEVIPTMSRLGASYPQILAILQAASRQANLAGPLAIDAPVVPPPPGADQQLAAKNTRGSKKDDAVEKAKFQSPTPRRGIFSRMFRNGN